MYLGVAYLLTPFIVVILLLLEKNTSISRFRLWCSHIQKRRFSHDAARIKNVMSDTQILRGNEDILKSRLKVHVILL